MEFRTEQEILEEMLRDAEEKKLITLNSGLLEKIKEGKYTENQYVLDLSIHAKIMEDFEVFCNNIYNSINLVRAEGESLDALGMLVNVPRYLSQPAIVDLTVSVPTSENVNIEIPAGTPLLLEGIYSGRNINYVTSEDVTLPSGVTSVNVRAESLDYGVQQELEIGSVVGLEGFPLLNVTNENKGTNGRNIEEDTDYRQRIMNWAVINSKGTRACIEDYLDNYDGLDAYKLIPLYNGMGTLKIVCDTLNSELENIKNGVMTNCMLITDKEVKCVLPGEYLLQSLTFYVHIEEKALIKTSLNEIRELLIAQVKTFVSGGFTRSNERIKGMGIGSAFYPAELIKYLLIQIPEISNIRTDVTQPISVPNDEIFKINAMEVIFE